MLGREFDFSARAFTRKEIIDMVLDACEARYAAQEALFGEEIFREVERSILLRTVDRHWMDHIDAMDDLKGSVSLQAYGQRDPLNEYRVQGADMFDMMVAEIREETTRAVLTVTPANKVKRVQIARPVDEGFEGDGQKQKKKVVVTVRKSEKIGRNDPCPCGSGKKYKFCCGINTPSV
jgi:preprotein translocase subunit SecA